MIVAIDIGNTNIVVGCIQDRDIITTMRFGTDKTKTEDEYAMLLMNMFLFHEIDFRRIEGGIISSVVPELRAIMQSAIEKLIGKRPLLVGAGLKTGLNIQIDNPAHLGNDLVADAVAACAKYKKPILIFDMGTATTLSVIDASGNYLGGMIIPGVRRSVDALSSNAAQLPHISLDPPEQLIGKNTIDCMKAGAIYGNAAMLDGIVERVENELGESATLVATGGLIRRIVPYCKREFICDDNLMLEGLALLYKKNQSKV